MRTTIRKILSILGVFVVGLTVASIIYVGYKEANNSFYLATPIENVFNVETIKVPDFVIGDDPIIIYNRTINKSFIGDFVVSIIDITDNAAICVGSGKGFTYNKGETIRENHTLSWYVNTRDIADCKDLIPGQYYMETSYVIQIEGFPDRYLTTSSNIFTIFSKYEEGTRP